MKASVDIPASTLLEAYREIKKKEGICEVLPTARFDILGFPFGTDEWKFGGLVCGLKDLNRNTGFGVILCKNCLRVPTRGEKHEDY